MSLFQLFFVPSKEITAFRNAAPVLFVTEKVIPVFNVMIYKVVAVSLPNANEMLSIFEADEMPSAVNSIFTESAANTFGAEKSENSNTQMRKNDKLLFMA